MSSVQQVIITNAGAAGTFTLNGSVALNPACGPAVMQSALSTIFGSGNVLVFSSLGSTLRVRTAITGIYYVVFVGALWGSAVPAMTVVNSASGSVTVQVNSVSHRVTRLMQDVCDIWTPQPLLSQQRGKTEAADFAMSFAPTYKGVPTFYQATPNFSEPKTIGRTKLTNEFTSDKWHFLSEVDIQDQYYIVMKTPGSPLYGRPWIVQGNSQLDVGLPGRHVESQWVYAEVGPEDLLHAGD